MSGSKSQHDTVSFQKMIDYLHERKEVRELSLKRNSVSCVSQELKWNKKCKTGNSFCNTIKLIMVVTMNECLV